MLSFPWDTENHLFFRLFHKTARGWQLVVFNCPNKPILLVRRKPLVSLIKSHIHELNDDHEILCIWLSGDDADENAIINGEFSIVFASPESIVKNQKWREMLRGKIYQKNLFGIVTDEVHVIPKW